MATPEETAEYFRDVTDCTNSDGWRWTRKTEIRHIRYKGDWTGHEAPWRRVLRAFGHAFGPRPDWEKELFPRETLKGWLWGVWASFVVNLPTDRHLPDGELAEGRIVCHWEEDGEYLQLVQPSVGKLLAEFLLAEPDNVHAQRIIAEMRRIEDDYSRCIPESEKADESPQG